MSDDKPRPQLGPEDDLEPAVQAFRSIILLAQRLRYLMDGRLRADGLTTRQAAMLTAIATLGEAALADAAAALSTTHQNAAQVVAALVRKGMVAEDRDPDDRRRRRLVATPASETA